MKIRTLAVPFICVCMVLAASCAKPLVEGSLTATEPVVKNIPSDPNSLYYSIKWAMTQCGYPIGTEDLIGGVIESKWVPVGAGSHYIDTISGKEYGANAAYYKMAVQIIPISGGMSQVAAQTRVKSIVRNIKSTGDKEKEILDKIIEYSRGSEIAVTNIGPEE